MADERHEYYLYYLREMSPQQRQLGEGICDATGIDDMVLMDCHYRPWSSFFEEPMRQRVLVSSFDRRVPITDKRLVKLVN